MKHSLIKGIVLSLSIMWLASCGKSEQSATAGIKYRQIERLARPGINEALVLSSAKHAAFNSIAPSLDLSTDATVASVRADAVAVLSAIHKYGDDNITHKAPTVANVAGGFLPDVMRINTAKDFSPSTVNSSATNSYPGAYGSDIAGSPPTDPDMDRAHPLMLTGGRMITDDVIDATYSYLLAGLQLQVVDGVSYCGNNIAQGHHALTGWTDQAFPCTNLQQAASFPFLAAPN